MAWVDGILGTNAETLAALLSGAFTSSLDRRKSHATLLQCSTSILLSRQSPASTLGERTTWRGELDFQMEGLSPTKGGILALLGDILGAGMTSFKETKENGECKLTLGT